MGRPKKAAAAPADDWNAREPAGDDHSATDHHDNEDAEHLDDQDEGEEDHHAGDAPDDDAAADFAARSTVDHDAEDGEPETVHTQDAGDGNSEGIAIGQVLTERQRAGLDPVDPATHVEQAGKRKHQTNAQTDHEQEGGLDPVSGTPNPGITSRHRHSAPGKLGDTDMSGNPPKPEPLATLDSQAKGVMDKLTKASKAEHARGRAAGNGWVDLRTLNVHKSVMDALVLSGHVEQETRPGGQFSPETGTVYRIASH